MKQFIISKSYIHNKRYSISGNLISAILMLFFPVYFEDIDTIAQNWLSRSPNILLTI